MPVWIEKPVVLVYHNEQLAEHGGMQGIRDEGLLESALGRPQNLLAYADKEPSIFELAAAYAFGLVRNHPFHDGNKRTALVLAIAFLDLNGVEFHAAPDDVYFTFYELAAGRVTEEELSIWLSRNSARHSR
jgi:death-on-curing protein